jgi:hypothetical protein
MRKFGRAMMRLGAWARAARNVAVIGALAAVGQCSAEQAQQVIVQCGHLAGLSKQQQALAMAELRKLPPGSVVGDTIVPDWLRMRDEIRACAGKAPNS